MACCRYGFFYLFAVVFGAVEAVALPAEMASGTRIVIKEHYSQSMSLLLVAGNLSAIIGPMIGADWCRLCFSWRFTNSFPGGRDLFCCVRFFADIC